LKALDLQFVVKKIVTIADCIIFYILQCALRKWYYVGLNCMVTRFR